MTHFNLIM